MSDLLINKVNEVYLKVTCEKHFAKELSEYFTFFVPGYQFVPAYRNRIWDGKIRLFDLRNNCLYIGLLSYLQLFCKERNYTFEIQDNLDVQDEFSVYHAQKFAESLNLESADRPITANEHQIKAFIHVMQQRRALILSPTASGKSLIIYLIVRQLLDYQKLKGLIIVPTTSLVEQLYSDFSDYGFDSQNNVHRIYQGKEKESTLPVIISTWQSLYKLPKEYFEQFDYIIGDEAHLFKAQSLTTILTSCTKAKYRIGLTGTLDGTKTHKLVLEGLFGEVEKVISTKELIDKGKLSNFDIKCLVIKHTDEDCLKLKDKTYQDEIKYLIENEQRNKFIKNLAVSLQKNTLVLYQMVDKHGKILYNLIKDTKNIGERKVFFHNIIFAMPTKSTIRTLQSIGRGLRQNEGKEVATLYDIADDLRYKKHMNFTLKHFIERTKIYNEEQFPFKIYKIGLKNG